MGFISGGLRAHKFAYNFQALIWVSRLSRPGEILDMSPRVHSHLWIKPSFLSIGPQITHYYVLMHGTLFHGSPNTLSSMPPACALVVWMERQTDTWGVAGCASRLESRRGTARGELDRCRKGLESTLISGGEVHSKRGPQDINPHRRRPVGSQSRAQPLTHSCTRTGAF